MAVITPLAVAYENGPAPHVYLYDVLQGASLVATPPLLDGATSSTYYVSSDLTSFLENPLFNSGGGGGSMRPNSGFLYPRGQG